MPGGDGTGPSRLSDPSLARSRSADEVRMIGQGPGTGRGMGRGGGRGRMGGNRSGAGPEGYCICPSCGAKILHKVSIPCYSLNCPKCGTKMARE